MAALLNAAGPSAALLEGRAAAAGSRVAWCDFDRVADDDDDGGGSGGAGGRLVLIGAY